MSTNQQIDALVEITEILSGPLPFLEKCESALAVLADFTGSELVTIRELNEDDSTLDLVAFYNNLVDSKDIRASISANDFWSGQAIESGSPVAVNDYSDLDIQPRGYLTGVRSAMSIPIQVEGHIFGTIGFGSRSTGHYPDDTIRTLITIGAVVGMMIGKARVQESSSRSIAILEEAPLGIVLVDDDGVMIQTNRHLETLFGYNGGELAGRSVEILVSESLRNIHISHRDGYIRHPVSRPMGEGLRLMGQRKDGSQFPVSIGLSAIHTSEGRLTMAHVVDDTYQSELEEFLKTTGLRLGDRLEAREAEMAVVDQVAKIITSTLEFDQEYDRFAVEIRKLVDFDRASLIEVDRGQNGYTIKNTWGLDVPSLRVGAKHILENSIVDQVMGPGIWDISERQAHSATPPVLSSLNTAGLRSLILAPLLANDEVIGAMSLVSIHPDAFGPRDLAILERLASQVAPAVENARLYQDAQERALEIQRLNESTNRILDSNPSALVVLRGSDRVVVRVNDSFCAAFNLEKTKVEGQPLSQVLDWVGLEECIRECLSSPSGEIRREMKYPARDGIARWFSVSAAPLLVEGDMVSENETLLVLNDVTEERQQQERLQEQSRLASIGELASGVAHEINNPLAAIHGITELLELEDLPVQAAEDIRKIQEASQRAAKVVQNLLSFARKSEPEKRYLGVAAIVDRATALKEHDFNLRNIQVTANHSVGAPSTMVDEHQMIQVILNILTNAEQAIAARQGPGQITLATRLVNDMIRISITDDGLGIPTENLRSIFDPFFTTKGVGEGTGLGLSICYGMVREHGGAMWVESDPGTGSTFHIELPVLPDEAHAVTQSTDDDAVPVTSRRILVVDDESLLRDILDRALSSDGHDVDVAPTGDHAWNVIQETEFDVIFLDLRMPGIDGQELYKLIYEFSPDLANKVVFMTGDTASGDTLRFLNSTARPVLSKPFTIQAVRQLL